jgi:membrane associated rhomboid family serine protease
MRQRPSPERRPPAAPIVAGSIIVGSMVLGAGVGFALGSLGGIAVLTGLVGLFVGLVLGFVLVYDRYRDL